MPHLCAKLSELIWGNYDSTTYKVIKHCSMRIQLLVSVKDTLFSSISLLFSKNSLRKSSSYWYSVLFITPASISMRKSQ